MTLPKRSKATAWATSCPFSARASGIFSATSLSGSIGSPASASGAPPARCAATGANTSRPWNVAAVGSRRCGERAIVDRLGDAAEALRGRQQQAVVRPDEDAVLLGGAQRDGAPLGPDLGVDDREVHAGREVRQRAPQHERAGADVVARRCRA